MIKGFFDRRKTITVLISALSVGLLVFLDQLIKCIIADKIDYVTESVSVIDNFFAIVHWHNEGAAWGMFENYTWILAVLSLVASVLFIYMIICSKAKLATISFVLIVSGAVGNVIDRIHLGYVIDYLSFYNLFGYNFPAFNLADICVVSGSIGLILCMLFVKTPIFDERTLAGRLLSDDGKKKNKSEEISEDKTEDVSGE